MENEKRNELLSRLSADVSNEAIKKFYEETENMQPGIGDIVDGYKSFVFDLGGNFLNIAEKYLQCLKVSRDNEIVGKTSLKARIKDFSSSKINTDEKILDDVFGMELVTATEFEKEVLILFNHIAFDISKNTIHEKVNTGYNAYHCVGDFSPKEDIDSDEIRKIIEQTKAKVQRYAKNDPRYNEDEMEEEKVFPHLLKYTEDSENLEEITAVMREMCQKARELNIERERMPIIEFHFLTSEKEQEALRGTKANHAVYKKTNTSVIEKYFREGRLIRGINAPWKFVSDGDELKLQDFYQTLIENWAFLKDDIVTRRKEGKESKDKETISKFDKLTASQFPFFRKYLDGDNEYPENKTAEKWGVLKALIIANKIDKNKKSKPIKYGLTEGIDEIWK